MKWQSRAGKVWRGNLKTTCITSKVNCYPARFSRIATEENVAFKDCTVVFLVSGSDSDTGRENPQQRIISGIGETGFWRIKKREKLIKERKDLYQIPHINRCLQRILYISRFSRSHWIFHIIHINLQILNKKQKGPKTPIWSRCKCLYFGDIL